MAAISSEISANDHHHDSFAKHTSEANLALKAALVDCVQCHGKLENDRNVILNLYQKISKENRGDLSKLSNYNRSKLKTAYTNGLKNCSVESQKLRECLRLVHELRRFKDEKLSHSGFSSPLPSKTKIAASSSNVSNSNSSIANSTSLTLAATLGTTSASNTAAAAAGSGKGQAGAAPTVGTTPGGNRRQIVAGPGSAGRHGSSTGQITLRRGALMRLLQRTAASLPLWLPSLEGDQSAPSLCGALPAPANHVCSPGDLVAVRVKGSDGDENWILAEVKNYDDSGRYEVEDIDEEQKECYVLNKKRLVALPHWRAHPLLNPDALFPLGATVWALYPQTTCFYKGVVQRQPHGPSDPYVIVFEDNLSSTGFSPPFEVPQRYIVTIK